MQTLMLRVGVADPRACASWLQRQELVRAPSSPEDHPDAAHTAMTRLSMGHPEGHDTRTGVWSWLRHRSLRQMGGRMKPQSLSSQTPLSSLSPSLDCPNLQPSCLLPGFKDSFSFVQNILCSPTGNKSENSKGVVATATTTSWKVSELLPPTPGTAEIQKA